MNKIEVKNDILPIVKKYGSDYKIGLFKSQDCTISFGLEGSTKYNMLLDLNNPNQQFEFISENEIYTRLLNQTDTHFDKENNFINSPLPMPDNTYLITINPLKYIKNQSQKRTDINEEILLKYLRTEFMEKVKYQKLKKIILHNNYLFGLFQNSEFHNEQPIQRITQFLEKKESLEKLLELSKN